MARVVLIVPTASYRVPDFLAAAAKLGVEVVVASEHRQALSGSLGDRALVVGLRDPRRGADAVVALARRTPVDAVVAVDEQGVEVAAIAAERLGLRASPPAAVRRTRDKAALRAALDAGGVGQPRHALMGDDLPAIGFPCVLKPLSLSASRGVIRADTPAAARDAARRIRTIVGDPTAPLLVEQFIPGPEVALEGLLRGGRLEPLALFDKPDALDGPYFEETIYVTPSRLPAATRAAVERAVAAACAALDLREGPIHAEARIAADGPIVLEVAARSIGGLCARTLRFGLGLSLEELILRHALDLPLDHIAREPDATGVMMLPIPRAGRLVDVTGRDRALAVDGIRGLEITVPRGARVEPLPAGDRYLGFLFGRGPSPALVERSLREAHARLDVRIAA